MRKIIKKQLMDFVQTLKETNTLIQNKFNEMTDEKDRSLEEDFLKTLTIVQQSVIEAGELIEKNEGNGTPAVCILENYCEQLYELSNEKDCEKANDILKNMVELTEKEESEISKFQSELEIVFMPYKASMWDCMESIWIAASKDKQCKCSVVPIPYFDRTEDGSLGEAHYEAELLPANIPVIAFSDYNFAENRPDIIYIHNPYDSGNRVTSVHPAFYSEELKKYTDMLVYIPYYITSGELPKSHALLPAYIYADKIIAQSDCMAMGIDKRIPREKILSIGSPKAERMIKFEVEKQKLKDNCIPKEWKEKIGNKKVVFYNTSISSLLEGKEERLDKIEELFKTAAKRDDIVILWREHPLLEATLNSMCPNLKKRFDNLRRDFIKSGIGIIDKTADVEISAAISDAYVGESSSSIVDLMRVVNKPRFLQGKKVYYQPTTDEIASDRTLSVCKSGEDFWFVSYRLQMLCKWNMNSKKTEVVAEVPDMPYVSYFQYVQIVNYKNKLILVPQRANSLCVYDIETGKFEKHYFKDELADNCFGKAYVYEHYVFLIPMDYPAIVKFDVTTGEFCYYDKCIHEILETMGENHTGSPFAWGVSRYEDELFIASIWENCILIFNLKNQNYRIVRVGDKNNKYRGMVSDKDYSWLILCDSQKVVRWERNTGEIKEYTDFPQDFVSGSIPFKNIVGFEDELYLIPCNANHICKLDKSTGKITYAQFELPYTEGTYKSEYYMKTGVYYDFASRISDREFVMMSLYDDSFIIADIITKKCKVIPLRIDDYMYYVAKKSTNDNYEIGECEGNTLSEYFEMVAKDVFGANNRKKVSINYKKELHIGEDIHNEIKKCVLVKCESNH